MSLKIQHAGQTDRGLVRKDNEDNWTADAEFGLYIVSDGLGGHFAGALASQIVVEALPVLLRQRLRGIDDLADPRAKERVNEALCELSTKVHDETHGQPGLEGMGATVVLALARGSKALIAHMGDSRAYLLRDGQLRQLTKDHSIVQLLIDSGDITPEEALEHPARCEVTRSVGMEGDPLPAAALWELKPEDRLMLCSDGLTGMVNHEVIQSILEDEQDPASTCRRLVDAANAAGGKDNVTVLVVDVTAPKTRDERCEMKPKRS